MRKWLILILKRLLNWLEPPPPPPPPDPMFLRAVELVAWANTSIPGASYKEKREEVRRRLQKEFPERKLRKILLTIERAVNADATDES